MRVAIIFLVALTLVGFSLFYNSEKKNVYLSAPGTLAQDKAATSLDHKPASSSLFEKCENKVFRNYTTAIQKLRSKNFNIILVGEVHGNKNSLEFVQSLIEDQLNKGESTSLLLEVPQNEGFSFDAFFENKLTLEDVVSQIPKGGFWANNSDGRQSCGMFNLMVNLSRHPQREFLTLQLIAPTRDDYFSTKLKGHIMAKKLEQYTLKKPNEFVISLTGRNYQRYDPHYPLEQQSSMCGKAKSIIDRNIICIASVGLSLPNQETPCKVGERFDLVEPSALESPHYEVFDLILSSTSGCVDFTDLAIPR